MNSIRYLLPTVFLLISCLGAYAQITVERRDFGNHYNARAAYFQKIGDYRLSVCAGFIAVHFTSKIKFTPRMDVVSRPLSDQCSTVRPADTSITHVVLHYCSNAVLKPQNPYQLKDILHIFESYAVSAHYLIDRKGVIYHLVDEDRVARHAGKGHLAHRARCRDDLNVRSIGIEMMAIGTQTEMRKLVSNFPYSKISEKDIGFTAAQYRSLARLLEDIEDRHGIIHHRKYIVGHDEYAPSRRSDPGSLFEWAKIGLTRSRARTRKQSSPSDDPTGHPSQ